MGGVGSGRFRVLTDFQREHRKKINYKNWIKRNKGWTREYMREYRKKNREACLKAERERKLRKKREMIEDMFERLMDKKDGFFSNDEIQINRKVKRIKPKIITELKSTEEQRKKWRGKFRGYYVVNSDKLCKRERDRYHKNKESISLRRKQLYMLKKVAI